MKPKRIQRKRTKGWRMPPNTVYVGRPSRYENPFRVEGKTKKMFRGNFGNVFSVTNRNFVVYAFRRFVEDAKLEKEIKQELKGKNLACWCRLSEKCHADILLEIANKE